MYAKSSYSNNNNNNNNDNNNNNNNKNNNSSNETKMMMILQWNLYKVDTISSKKCVRLMECPLYKCPFIETSL